MTLLFRRLWSEHRALCYRGCVGNSPGPIVGVLMLMKRKPWFVFALVGAMSACTMPLIAQEKLEKSLPKREAPPPSKNVRADQALIKDSGPAAASTQTAESKDVNTAV